MTWTKIDDQLHAHPKVQGAWHASPAAVGLHLLALSHSAAYLTDGHVSEAFVRTMLAAPAQRRRALAALLAAPPPFDTGLWVRTADGWVIHDYLDFNESREQVLSRRRSDSDRNASRRNPSGVQLDTTAPRVRAQPRGPTPTPFPIPSAS